MDEDFPLFQIIGLIVLFIVAFLISGCTLPTRKPVRAILQDGTKIACYDVRTQNCGMLFRGCEDGLTYNCQQGVRLYND